MPAPVHRAILDFIFSVQFKSELIQLFIKSGDGACLATGGGVVAGLAVHEHNVAVIHRVELQVGSRPRQEAFEGEKGLQGCVLEQGLEVAPGTDDEARG